MKFPQQFRAGDFIQWRLDSTTDNFGEPISSPDWTVIYYFRTNTAFEGATVTGTAYLDGFQFSLASNVTEAFNVGDWFYQAVLPSLTLRGTSWPLLEEGFIFTGFANGKVAMIYPDSGAVRLELPITLNEGKSELERIVDVDGRSLIANDLLIAASYQGNIIAINLRDGRPAWQEEVSTVKDLTSNGNRVVVVDSKSILKAFGLATGALIWDQEDLQLRAVSYTHLTLPTKA